MAVEGQSWLELMARCTPLWRALIHSFAVCLALGLSCTHAPGSGVQPGFMPGEIWLDTDGNPINAHGGQILYYQGVYYWYGEVKSGTTFLPNCNKFWGGTRVDTIGVSCYCSTNLYDWKNEGVVLPAVSGNPQSDLYTGKVLERPRVVYNKASRNFVMWMHIDSENYSAARCGVAVSDTPTGPFKYLGSFRPDADVWPENWTGSNKTSGNVMVRDFSTGQMARDLTVFVDDDGKAYLFYSSEENPTMHVSLLTDDYLRTAGKYYRIFVGRSMEAPAVFKHEGKYYLIASGCTAWAPNAARLAVANNIFGPWTELGNPCEGAGADTTFDSQGTFVLPIQGRNDAFIFMADRWQQWDLSNSRYVWLPIEFTEDGRPILKWHDRWSLNDIVTSHLALKSR